eukprot:Sro188_g081280.2  (616) ;mRNA; f:74842-77090
MPDKNNPPIMKTTRRSARRRGQEPVVAPGFGTKQDIEKLSQDLSEGAEKPLPASSVEGATSSAWADFMKEEGVDLYGRSSSKDKDNNNDTTKSDDEPKQPQPQRKDASTKKKSGKRKAYNLDALAHPKFSSKKAKLAAAEKGGVLVQSGTLDVTVIGRKGINSKETPSYQISVPTRILPGIKITKVFTSSNACHSIAICSQGHAYGWGRNDQGQLTSTLPANVACPTLIESLADYTIVAAACGKSHTLVLTNAGTVMAVGANKVGQCGVKSTTDSVGQFKACVFPGEIKIAQIACGEQFSVALSEEGKIYTTGSSEYGQLGNGETGEYFVTASKLAFANCNVFTLRDTFMERDPAEESARSSYKHDKLTKIQEDIRIQSIACGKNHTIAVEANYEKDEEDDDDHQRLRVFSWGCGNYGVLGHEIQADEYYPREIATLGSTLWLPPGPLTASAGASCSMLKTSNGHVYYFGKHRSVGEAEMKPKLVEALANNRHVVSHCDGGAQTVICSTETAQTVAWGQGPHGELGLGTAKSSAKPQFVESLTGCRVQHLACAYGHTLYVIKDEDAEDKKAIEKLPLLPKTAKADLEAVWASMPAGGAGGGKPGKPGRKKSAKKD